MSTATATPLETVTPLVKDWCAAHAARIQACYLKDDLKDGVTLVLVQRQEVGFDEPLGRSLDAFLDIVYRTQGVFVLDQMTGPGPEDDLCRAYPVRPSDRVFGE